MRVQMLILWFKGLKNVANLVNVKKVGFARRVTRLAAGSPFCEGRVTVLADPTFLHINTLTRPAGLTRSRRDNQEYVRALLALSKGSTIFSVDPAGG